MKPFIKPRPANQPAPATPAPATAEPSVTPGELSILALAAAIADDTERADYLDRACRGDRALRERIETRIAEKPAPIAAPAIVQPREIAPHGQAVALVPMSAAQLANAAAPPPRPATIPWLTATLLATAAGALAVLFLQEKSTRSKAETEALNSRAIAEAIHRDLAESEAAALAARTAAERAEKAGATATAERDAALAAADSEKTARSNAETAAAQAAKRAETAEAAAKAEAEKQQAAAAAQRTASETLARTLTTLANARLEARNHPAALQSAREALELHTALGTTGWPLIETRIALGGALLQTSRDTAATTAEFLAAAAAIEALGPPATDADKASLAAASKRIVQFFTLTGRRQDAAEWKRKFDALAKPPAP